MKYLLGIDIGTSSTKAILFNTEGIGLASSAAEYELCQPFNGWAEQNPSDWWNAVCKTCQSVISKSDINPSDIRGIGLSGQMHGLVMLDENNQVIRPAILWCDSRTGKECDELTELVGKEKLVSITANPAAVGFTASKILWVKKHEPENYKRCKHILLPKDYIRFRLTGEYATDVSDASGMQLLDVPKRCWSKEVLAKLDIDSSLLCKVHESPEITGFTSAKAAAATGLATGIPVAAGAGDNAAAAVGMGVVSEGKMFTSIGSSGVVYAHAKKPLIDPAGRVHTFCCAVPGEWHLMGVTQAAGISLKWFKENFCGDIDEQAKSQGISAYQLMSKKAAQSPLGSNKLLYLPYLMGERTPHLDPDCRGVFFGLSAMHTRSDLIRAIMEGVSFSLLDCYSILHKAGLRSEEMIACGGGASSAFWRQMLADMFACPVQIPLSQEGPALGAALLAGVATGVYATVAEACQMVTKTGTPALPNIKATESYLGFYAVYRRLYPQLKDAFGGLSELA